jgi:hypothetical protein
LPIEKPASSHSNFTSIWHTYCLIFYMISFADKGKIGLAFFGKKENPMALLRN